MDTIKQWVYAQIERWAQDNYESAEAWSQGPSWIQKAETERISFIKEKKKEFDDLIKATNGSN